MVEEYYISYLLRLWQSGEGKSTVWRASLEDPHTGERYGFADLENLWTFLQQQMKERAEPTKRPPDS